LWAFGDRLRRQVQWDPEWRDNPLAVNEVNDRNRRFLTNYIRSELGERADELFDKCLPDYPPLGKRPLMDHGWFKTVARDDVELITEDISRITEHAIVTTDGLVHEVDLIVLATGFQPQRMLAPMEIRGRTGRSLRDLWGDDDARAYLGITVPEFPNLFCLLGPNSFIGHGGSGMLTIELQVRYVMEILALMTAQGIASVECRQEVHDTYNEELAAALAETVWAHPGISTYYRNAAGRIVVPMPWTNVEYRRRVLRPDPEDFILN
jgi:4-hydroxyacetophenone monooxygenase